ncbi:MAG TPA: hypothetical protein PLP19_09790 [bacterium]|nr:hypothetical protein [bacterium]HPN43769.1 hypothetical protein [bacterium]
MQITSVSPYHDPLSKTRDTQEKSKETKSTGYNSEKLTFTRMMNERLFEFYNQKGQVSQQTEEVVEDNNEDLTDRESIRKEVWRQTYALLQEATARLQTGSKSASYDKTGRIAGEEMDPFGIGAYYADHPDDWKKVQLGIVPDYFNVENTGKRILDIWMPQDGAVLDAAGVEHARQNIIKAYSEVSEMFGNKLPQLVLDTKEYVLEKLSEMAA